MRFLLALLLLLPSSASAQSWGNSYPSWGDGWGAWSATAGGAAPTCGDPPSTALAVWLDGRSIDGADNATLANLDPITTWTDLGSIGDDPTQGGASTLKPTFIASCVNGLACARFDGGDFLRATTASNYTFLHNGTGATIYSVVKTSASALGHIAATATGSSTVRGVGHRYNTTFRANFFMSDGVALRVSATSAINAFVADTFNVMTSRLVNESPPARVFLNGTQVDSGGTATFSPDPPVVALTIGANSASASQLTGDVAQILIYADAHDDTERGEVEDWIDCVYGVMPVAVAALDPGRANFYGDSLTAVRAPVQEYPSKLSRVLATGLGYDITNRAVGGAKTADILVQVEGEAQTEIRFATALGGVNDIANTTDTAATIIGRLELIWAEQSTFSDVVVAVTIPPFKGIPQWTPTKGQTLDDLNALILGSPTPDVVVDANTALRNPSDPDSLLPLFDLGDFIHLSDAGTTELADVWLAANGLP